MCFFHWHDRWWRGARLFLKSCLRSERSDDQRSQSKTQTYTLAPLPHSSSSPMCGRCQPLTALLMPPRRWSVPAEALRSGSGLQHHHGMSGRQQQRPDQLQLPVWENHGEAPAGAGKFGAAYLFLISFKLSVNTCARVSARLCRLCGSLSHQVDIYSLLPV